MEKKILSKIKDELMNRKNQIEKDLTGFAKKDKDDYVSSFPEYGSENDENAQEVSQYSTNVATEKILEKILKDINSALKKITKKEFGVCKYCGKPIEEKRLLIRPFSSACVKCKTKLQDKK
ncbi:MAG: TraR/DksA C4-type zinc finger protein [bacterium]